MCAPTTPFGYRSTSTLSLSHTLWCAMCMYVHENALNSSVFGAGAKTKREYSTEEAQSTLTMCVYAQAAAKHKFHSPALFVVIIYVLCTLRAHIKCALCRALRLKQMIFPSFLTHSSHFLNNTYLQCVMWTLFFRYPKIIVYTFFISLLVLRP